MLHFSKVLRGSGLVLSVVGKHSGGIKKFIPTALEGETLEVQVTYEANGNGEAVPMPQIILDSRWKDIAIRKVRFVGDGIDTTVPMEWF
jgi:hypothetical protein